MANRFSCTCILTCPRATDGEADASFGQSSKLASDWVIFDSCGQGGAAKDSRTQDCEVKVDWEGSDLLCQDPGWESSWDKGFGKVSCVHHTVCNGPSQNLGA